MTDQIDLKGEVWLSCIIRKGWEPRLAWASSVDALYNDIEQYCREVLGLNTLGLDTLDELENLLFTEKNQSLFWEQAR